MEYFLTVQDQFGNENKKKKLGGNENSWRNEY